MKFRRYPKFFSGQYSVPIGTHSFLSGRYPVPLGTQKFFSDWYPVRSSTKSVSTILYLAGTRYLSVQNFFILVVPGTHGYQSTAHADPWSELKVKKGYRDAENLIRESREIEILIRGLKFIIQTLTSCSPVSPQLVLKYLNIKLSIMNYDCQNKSTLPSSHFVPLFHTFSEIFSLNFF